MQIFSTALLFLGAVLLFANYFTKHCCDKVEVKSSIDKQRVSIENPLVYSFEITNKKLLILPVIKIIFTLPTSFEIETDKKIVQAEKIDQTTYVYTITTSLLSYQKVKKRIKFIPRKRGYYLLRVSVRLLDFVGIRNVSLIENQETVILVHPRGNKEVSSFVDSNSFQGNQIISRWILQDPIFYSGVREYDQRDSMKDIDWKASAKSNRLLVKKYDATSDTEIVAFLFAEYKDRFQHDYDEFVENSIEMIAFMIKEAYRYQIPFGMATNLTMKNKMNDLCEVTSGKLHMIQLFDFLSCISDYAGYSPIDYMKTNFSSFEKKNRIFIMFIYEINEPYSKMLNQLAKFGYKIKIFVYRSCTVLLHSSIELYKLKGEKNTNESYQ